MEENPMQLQDGYSIERVLRLKRIDGMMFGVVQWQRYGLNQTTIQTIQYLKTIPALQDEIKRLQEIFNQNQRKKAAAHLTDLYTENYIKTIFSKTNPEVQEAEEDPLIIKNKTFQSSTGRKIQQEPNEQIVRTSFRKLRPRTTLELTAYQKADCNLKAKEKVQTLLEHGLEPFGINNYFELQRILDDVNESLLYEFRQKWPKTDLVVKEVKGFYIQGTQYQFCVNIDDKVIVVPLNLMKKIFPQSLFNYLTWFLKNARQIMKKQIQQTKPLDRYKKKLSKYASIPSNLLNIIENMGLESRSEDEYERIYKSEDEFLDRNIQGDDDEDENLDEDQLQDQDQDLDIYFGLDREQIQMDIKRQQEEIVANPMRNKNKEKERQISGMSEKRPIVINLDSDEEDLRNMINLDFHKNIEQRKNKEMDAHIYFNEQSESEQNQMFRNMQISQVRATNKINQQRAILRSLDLKENMRMSEMMAMDEMNEKRGQEMNLDFDEDQYSEIRENMNIGENRKMGEEKLINQGINEKTIMRQNMEISEKMEISEDMGRIENWTIREKTQEEGKKKKLAETLQAVCNQILNQISQVLSQVHPGYKFQQSESNSPQQVSSSPQQESSSLQQKSNYAQQESSSSQKESNYAQQESSSDNYEIGESLSKYSQAFRYYCGDKRTKINEGLRSRRETQFKRPNRLQNRNLAFQIGSRASQQSAYQRRNLSFQTGPRASQQSAYQRGNLALRTGHRASQQPVYQREFERPSQAQKRTRDFSANKPGGVKKLFKYD